jgi:glycosyltransferase involved in cell wall biosynthesis
MRVAHIVKDNVGARFAYDEVVYLKDHGVEVCVIMPVHLPGHMAGLYQEAGVPLYDLDPNLYPNGPVRSLKNARRLRAALAEFSPDIVHVHHVATCLLLRLATGRRPRFKRLFEVHGPLHLESPHTRAADLRTKSGADYYVATSEATRRIYESHGVDDARIETVYSGFRTNDWIKEPTGRLREAMGIGPDVPLVGLVAWFYPPKRILGQRVGLKGHDLFINAIPEISARHREARFVIVGGELSGSERYAQSLRDLAERRGVADVLTFLGPRTDVAEIQPDLDVAVHPSRSENPGGAVYTLLSGVPTAGAAVGGIPEVVRDGETGYLFERDDVAGLASSVVRLLDNPETARAMATKGRALVQELFDISQTAPRVLSYYERLTA